MNDLPNLAVCMCCGDILHSKHRHDFVMCGCDNQSAVDGGPDYFKRCGKDLSKVKNCITGAEARRLSYIVKDNPPTWAQKAPKAPTMKDAISIIEGLVFGDDPEVANDAARKFLERVKK